MQDGKRKILHITPHMGGGVGKVILEYLKFNTGKDNLNELIALDFINENSKKVLSQYKICYSENVFGNIAKLSERIFNADVVILHWWNHPMLYQLLVNIELPELRLITWCHISGLTVPQILNKDIIDLSDRFIFTSPISYKSELIKQFNEKQLSKLGHIWSTTGAERAKKVEKNYNANNFVVGYVGTVDYSKLHKNFLKMSSLINIKNISFVVCGGGNNENEIKNECNGMGLSDRFFFTGWVENVENYLENFSVFGYPLNNQHYGTCDQALVEAMCAGVVPVVFGNEMERTMVDHMETGIIVNSDKAYIEAIELLYNDKNLLKTLSHRAKFVATRRYSLQNMEDMWELEISEIIKKKKTKKDILRKKLRYEPFDLFLESIKADSEIAQLVNNIVLEKKIGINKKCITEGLLSKTKGSPQHYLDLLGEDSRLLKIIEFLKNS